MSFVFQKRKGGSVGRVFAFASMANQPHTLENRYIPGSGVGGTNISNRRALYRRATVPRVVQPIPSTSQLICSKNNITDGGFTIGYTVYKDMDNEYYTNEFDPISYQPQFFPGMADFIDGNIVAGDKNEEDRLMASYWNDLGNDLFDDWGYFYLYDVPTGKYYFPLLNPQNQNDGEFFTQTFSAFGRSFTITHGWAVQGIFKFDISASDNLPFKFGAYGNMGSDGNEETTDLTQSYTINGNNLTLFYHHHKESGDYYEQMYSYWIPKKTVDNSSKTYNVYYDSDDMSMFSNEVTTGLLVYFSKSNDVKNWVINDLQICG